MRTSWLDGVVSLAATASALTAAWLLVVVVTVLPARDPSSAPGWTAFAVALLAFSALSFIDPRRSASRRSPRVVMAALSVVAVLVGGWVLMAAMSTTGHVEGYLVVIGAVVLVHGVVSLARSVAIGTGRVAIGR